MDVGKRIYFLIFLGFSWRNKWFLCNTIITYVLKILFESRTILKKRFESLVGTKAVFVSTKTQVNFR